MYLHKIKIDHFCLLNATPPIKMAVKENTEIIMKLNENGMNETPIITYLIDSTP